MPELDAATNAAGLRDRTPIERPSAPCHPMGHRSVLALDDNAQGQDAADLALDAADFALDAAERDAAAQAAGRR